MKDPDDRRGQAFKPPVDVAFAPTPRLDPALTKWAWQFYRHSTPQHVARTRELLRDLNLESRRLFVELSDDDAVVITATNRSGDDKPLDRYEEIYDSWSWE